MDYDLRDRISNIMVLVSYILFVLSLIYLENHKYEEMMYCLIPSVVLAIIIPFLEANDIR